MFKECRHILPDGSRCKAAALKDRPFCYHHDRIHRALLHQKASKTRLNLPALEDRGSILMAISQVIGALADGRIDGTKAGRVIYALQVAAQFAPAYPRSPSSNQVESIERTPDGDDLAPVAIECNPPDDCDACPYEDECPYNESDEDAEEEDKDDEEEEDAEEDGSDDADEDEEPRVAANEDGTPDVK